jgi:hypothetical protein
MTKKLGVLLLTLPVFLSACGGLSEVTPRVVEGFADANVDGTAIGFRESSTDTSGESFIVSGADFRQGDAPMREGGAATCIKAGAKAQPVRLGLVRVEAGEGFSGRDHVVWVHCR